MTLTCTAVALAVLCAATVAVTLPNQPAAISQPTVTLDHATIIGKANGTVNQFLGLPFAQPPYVPHTAVFVRARVADFLRPVCFRNNHGQ